MQEREQAAATMHIGAVAERTALSLRTLRHYDTVGLVTPSGRTEGGFRLYTEADVQRLLLVRRMKPLGYTLEEMAEVLRASDDAAAGEPGSRDRLQQYLSDAERRRADLARKTAMADEFIAQIGAVLAQPPR
ncbi:MerR family transcriptional regulator [Pseudactinotalea terrae]|uniref:MerR family transcriptional regulator n=1 Tax=Pseudactinotalea terrae TaxID=1743262 RepID=UPI0012E13EA7|nr:MerR family transcriptional regulator [Pseudactinotalea terrae]